MVIDEAQGATIEPESAEDVASTLRRASDARQSVAIRGGGTKAHWGRRSRAADITLSTRRLNRVLAHEHGDLVATIEAGATLRDVNAALARHGQWLPLDPPFDDRATIGGILAANDSGPLRHRHGTPRDLVIGVRLATTDGVLAQAGGKVVKNVAGYDLSKLVSGSFGSLAVIVNATFKLAPLPRASKTVVVEAEDDDALEQIVRAVMASQLEPLAFDVRVEIDPVSVGDRRVGESVGGAAGGGSQDVSLAGRAVNAAVGPRAIALLRFATVPDAIEAQIGQLNGLVASGARPPSPAVHGDAGDREREAAAEEPCRVYVVEGDAEHDAWRDHTGAIWSEAALATADAPAAADGSSAAASAERSAAAIGSAGELPRASAAGAASREDPSGASPAVVRVSWLPANLATMIAAIERALANAADANGGTAPLATLVGRAAIGAGHLRVDATARAQAVLVDHLRASPHVGNVVVVRGSDELTSLVDAWGPQGDRERLFATIKKALDPHGILNPGRGPL